LRATPISPFNYDPEVAAKSCFDLDTGNPIPPDCLLSYAEVINGYDTHSESKFDYGNLPGWTQRKHVQVTSVKYIGKEGNKLEEQEVGLSTDEIIEYGMDIEQAVSKLKEAATTNSYQELADILEVSRAEVSRICSDKRKPSVVLAEKILETEFPEGEFGRAVEHGVIEIDIEDNK
jgi:transcriptional regulator with XRE-family HTH domain